MLSQKYILRRLILLFLIFRIISISYAKNLNIWPRFGYFFYKFFNNNIAAFFILSASRVHLSFVIKKLFIEIKIFFSFNNNPNILPAQGTL